MQSRASSSRPKAALLLLACFLAASHSCNSGVIDVVSDVGTTSRPDAKRRADGVIPVDDQGLNMDLPAKAGEACLFNKCAEGLICIANLCHTMCSTDCGDAAPECPTGIGCYWASSFTGACIPGSAKVGETCGDGIYCVAKALCVSVSGRQRCYALCKYTCPTGTRCTKTNQGCEVCL